jgi:hypothetical protein
MAAHMPEEEPLMDKGSAVVSLPHITGVVVAVVLVHRVQIALLAVLAVLAWPLQSQGLL